MSATKSPSSAEKAKKHRSSNRRRKKKKKSRRPPQKKTVEPTVSAAPSDVQQRKAQPKGQPDGEARVKASPVARRVAAEFGVDLSAVKGTGPDGRVTETDVRAAAKSEVGGVDNADVK